MTILHVYRWLTATILTLASTPALSAPPARTQAPVRATPVRPDIRPDYTGLYLRVLEPSQSRRLDVTAPLALVRFRCGFAPECRPSDSWSFEFSRALHVAAFDPSDILITPALASASIRLGSRWMVVAGDAAPNQRYTVRFPTSLRAIDGGTLSEPAEATVEVGRPAVAIWSDAASLVTRRKDRPARLDVHTAGIETLRVRIQRVEDADWHRFLATKTGADRTRRVGDLPGQSVEDHLVRVVASDPSSGAATTALAVPPGQHVVVVEAADPAVVDGTRASAIAPVMRWLQTTDLSADVVHDGRDMAVWVTDAVAGQPVPEARVRLVTNDALIAEAISGADGIARLKLPTFEQATGLRLVVTHDDDRLMVPDRMVGWDLPSPWQAGAVPLTRPALELPPVGSDAAWIRSDRDWAIGAPVTVEATNAQVELEWQALVEAHSFRPAYAPGFRFASHARVDPFVRHATTQPDAAGVHRLGLSLESVDLQRSVRVSVRASSGGTSGIHRRLVHPGARFVGLRGTAELVAAGAPLAFDVAVVDVDGADRLGSSWTATLARRSGGRWVPLTAPPCRGRSGVAPQRCTFDGQGPGHYRVTARVHDAQRNAHVADTDVFITGADSAWVPEPPVGGSGTLWMHADKTRYQPGETARLIAHSPWPAGHGLLVVSEGGRKGVSVVEIEGAWTWLTVPISTAVDGAVDVAWRVVSPEGQRSTGSLTLNVGSQ